MLWCMIFKIFISKRKTSYLPRGKIFGGHVLSFVKK